MSLINLYKPIRKISYLLTSALIVALLVYFLLVKNFSLVGLFLVIGTSLLFFFLWLKLHPGPSEVTDATQVIQAIGNGRPTFLNIYSNY
ncbi:hypothetical protein GWO43_07700 [candidate division KSB1 bacterium]|nr:hypothetical protein [candidate division KSB1 bacterium]NIR73145.1 hypothetical protein [candidate division KSB1 bacterium]NIS23848.1 hypothetical protein [candidate division KSB1 bacterium]NIT70769.1 hypothetical protein [candidate division KSB1 bacterium]NIU24497.1 hypothetical protein [candidate division KSB1 bacterium]